MTDPEQRPEPATDPMDVAYSAALEALASEVDMAEWFVNLMAAVAVSPAVAAGDVPFLRRTGSWEAAGVSDLVESAGAYADPRFVARDARTLLHDMRTVDIIRWLGDGLREHQGASDAVVAQFEALAVAVEADRQARLDRLFADDPDPATPDATERSNPGDHVGPNEPSQIERPS